MLHVKVTDLGGVFFVGFSLKQQWQSCAPQAPGAGQDWALPGQPRLSSSINQTLESELKLF